MPQDIFDFSSGLHVVSRNVLGIARKRGGLQGLVEFEASFWAPGFFRGLLMGAWLLLLRGPGNSLRYLGGPAALEEPGGSAIIEPGVALKSLERNRSLEGRALKSLEER